MINKEKLIHVKECDVYVHKTTHKVYYIGHGPRTSGQLKEIHFYSDRLGRKVYSNLAQGLTSVRLSHVLALALIPRPLGATRIRHRNGDLSDDTISNLEWVVPYSSPKEWSQQYREQNVNLSFWDPEHKCCRQKWCDRAAVAHLLHLKPEARGEWRPEYAPKSKTKRGNRK